MNNDRTDDLIDAELVTHDDLPERGDREFSDDVDDTADQELIDAATDELLDEDVAAEDLSAQDLINDGVAVEDLEFSNTGRREFEADLEDPGHQDTIDERLRQEVPDPNSAVVPGYDDAAEDPENL